MKYSINKSTVAWRVLDGEAVIINTKTSFYYSLNKTGTRIWNLLAEKDRSRDELVKVLALHYKKNVSDIDEDVQELLEELIKEGLTASK